MLTHNLARDAPSANLRFARLRENTLSARHLRILSSPPDGQGVIILVKTLLLERFQVDYYSSPYNLSEFQMLCFTGAKKAYIKL
jgi:hypothetical protein